MPLQLVAGCYNHGELGLQQDHARAIELYARAAELGNNTACLNLGNHHRRGRFEEGQVPLRGRGYGRKRRGTI